MSARKKKVRKVIWNGYCPDIYHVRHLFYWTSGRFDSDPFLALVGGVSKNKRTDCPIKINITVTYEVKK